MFQIFQLVQTQAFQIPKNPCRLFQLISPVKLIRAENLLIQPSLLVDILLWKKSIQILVENQIQIPVEWNLLDHIRPVIVNLLNYQTQHPNQSIHLCQSQTFNPVQNPFLMFQLMNQFLKFHASNQKESSFRSCSVMILIPNPPVNRPLLNKLRKQFLPSTR